MKYIKTFESKTNELLAPNGNVSNLSYELYHYVRSNSFKEWFGDWENDKENSSKIIDDNGEPKLLYHGTKKIFNNFNEENQLIGWLGKGFYFTDDIQISKNYGKVIEVFLNIRTPFIVNGQSPSDVISEINSMYNDLNESDVSVTLKKHSYDGVEFNHWDIGYMISCFRSNQIDIIKKTHYKQ